MILKGLGAPQGGRGPETSGDTHPPTCDLEASGAAPEVAQGPGNQRKCPPR